MAGREDREYIADGRLHPFKEVTKELRAIRQLLEKLAGPAPAGAAPVQFGAPTAFPSLLDFAAAVTFGMRKSDSLMLADDIYVETVDLTTARSPPAAFDKLGNSIALTIFTLTGTIDLYINSKETTHKITLTALTYPQTMLIDWCRITEVYIGNTAQSALSAVIIAWKPAAPPTAPTETRTGAAITITSSDRALFRKEGDLNGDGVIDDQDIAIVKAAYGSTPGASNWNPAADFNGDGKVDVNDMTRIGGKRGLTIQQWKARR